MKNFNTWIEEGGLWDNIRKRKASGKKMRKKGEKGAPTADAIKSAQKEDAPANAVAHGGVDMNPTGRTRKMDKRMKYHPEKVYRRSRG
jgi:hypothetical protein